jgi:hypothetical protein
VPLDALIHPWAGDTFRNIPRQYRDAALDFRFAGRLQDNRWNVRGERTLYLADDPGVAAAEFVRHLELYRSLTLREEVIDRDIFRFTVAVERLLDLRDRAVLEALSITGAPGCFLDVQFARATAQFIRYGPGNVLGIIVPSMAFLDDADRWVMALFLERFSADPLRFIASAGLHATITVRQPASDT